MEDKGGIENSEGTPDPKERDPPTSRKQMRKLGEPPSEKCKGGQMAQRKKLDSAVETPASMTEKDGICPRQEDTARERRQRREQKREKREQKAKKRKEREDTKKKKRKEAEDKMKRVGELRTKNQPKILGWTVRQMGLSQRTPKGGKKGIGRTYITDLRA